MEINPVVDRKPLRVIAGDTEPYEPFWNAISASESESGMAEIEFYGPISEYSWLGDEITPQKFKDDLYRVGGGGPVVVKINSPGGEVFAASTIRAILQDYPGQVIADIVGLAASAATIVTTGADVVRMRETALFMIHDPSALVYGTIDEVEQVLYILKTVKTAIINGYESRTGLSREKLAELMRSETWMDAATAHSLGFVDEITRGNQAKISPRLRAGFLNCLSDYTAPEPTAFISRLLENTENVDDNSTDLAENGVIMGDDPSFSADEVQKIRNYLLVFGPKWREYGVEKAV